MVICLLLAAATLLWPVRSRESPPGRRWPLDLRAAATGRRPVGAVVGAGWRGGSGSGSRPVQLLFLAGASGVAVLSFLVAGAAGLMAAAALLGTGTRLFRRSLQDRRDRAALTDIQAGLRMLSRELRAGAEPSVAAVNAGAAARGAGSEVLRTVARLARADDRPAAVGPAAEDAGPGHAARRTVARLRSGWLLTRRHGLAFTPMIDALAADLAEQIAAEAERAGQVAGPRMSGYVMAVLPLMGLALGIGMGADPFRVLLLTPVGNILLLVGVTLTCLGLLWSARIVRR